MSSEAGSSSGNSTRAPLLSSVNTTVFHNTSLEETLILLASSQFSCTKKNLPEISWLHKSFGAILLVLSNVIGKRPDLYFDGLCDKENIGQHFPVNCSDIGHSYEAFTYLFGRKSFIHDLSANKNYIVDLLRKLESI